VVVKVLGDRKVDAARVQETRWMGSGEFYRSVASEQRDFCENFPSPLHTILIFFTNLQVVVVCSQFRLYSYVSHVSICCQQKIVSRNEKLKEQISKTFSLQQ